MAGVHNDDPTTQTPGRRGRERDALGCRAYERLVFRGDRDRAPRKRGFHIIYAPNMEGGDPLAVRSRSAALVLAESLAAGTKLPPSNYKGTPQAPIDARTNLGALSMLTRTPGILVELGNLKNPADWALLSNDRVRDDVAAALATGVDKVLAG